MTLSKKIITLLAAVLILAMIVPGALAAADTSAEAGETTTVTFTFQNIYNVDGAFTVSDPQKILSTYSINVTDAGATAAVINGDRLWASPTAEPVKTTVSVAVTLIIKSSAAAGSSCTVTFNGIYGDANEEPGNEHDITRSATVTVKAPEGAAETPAPTPSTTPAPTPTPSTTPAPTAPSVDYSELQKQINIAGGLIPSDYTNESRNLLAAALTVAQNALNSKEQSMVTAAAEQLRTTIASLVPMDYSGLKAALSQADALLASEQAALLLQEISDAAQRGSELLQSGDQQEVDQAAKELTDILNRLADLLDVESETKVVIQEVPVEVLPEGDYCNIPAHHVWPVLFWVSLAVNVVLIGGIVFHVIRKTRNRRDFAPMVDYDIDDDI